MDDRLLERLLEERPEEVPERPPREPVLYCKTRTVRSGSLVEIECYPVYIGSYRRQLERVRVSPEAMRIVNDRNARKRFERLAEANFEPGKDYALTLTYAEAPEDQAECERELRNYRARVDRARKKLGLPRARCIGVIEYGKKGRLHHHLIIEGGLDRDVMERLWTKGYANCDRLQRGPGGLAGLCKYLTKGFSAKRENGRHRYFFTRNLVQPRITESRTRISRRQAERIREDATIAGEMIIRKKWPELELESLTVRASEWLPGAYIYGRLRRHERADEQGADLRAARLGPGERRGEPGGDPQRNRGPAGAAG